MPRSLLVVALIAILAPWVDRARADAIITGPACVIDGNTLQVGGRPQGEVCWGGIDVRLHGSIAPEERATCTDSRGREWDCGNQAKQALKRLIKQHSITCYHIDGEFFARMPVVTCVSGRLDLALEMVVMGLAKALHDQSKRYELEERDAKRARRGLWK